MQSALEHSSPSWTQIAFYLLASFIGGGGAFKLLTLWLNRKKVPAEIHETSARTDKTRAEARKINAEADAELNAIIERLHVRIDQMQLGVDEIRSERDEFQRRLDLQGIELKMRDEQVKRLMGVISARGIHLSDYDTPKE